MELCGAADRCCAGRHASAADGASSPFPVRRREESGAPAEEGPKHLCRLSSQPRNAASVFWPRFANRIGEKYGNKTSVANS